MRNLCLSLVLATSLLPCTSVNAAPADLPETGQTSCTDAAGAAVVCAGTGQDGDLKAGVAWPAPRFAVGTGATVECVTDSLTGLMWVRAPSGTTDTWENALTTANDLTLCGFSDWRLPNVNELESLVNMEAADQAGFLNAQGFSGVQGGSYWSSTHGVGFSVPTAWGVGMVDGVVAAYNRIVFSLYVWPVRAGQ
jgi:hypothetical protein